MRFGIIHLSPIYDLSFIIIFVMYLFFCFHMKDNACYLTSANPPTYKSNARYLLNIFLF